MKSQKNPDHLQCLMPNLGKRDSLCLRSGIFVMENQVEIWENIPFTKEFYQASSLGRIKSLKRNKELILKPAVNKNGYLYVNVSLKNKTKHVQVHSLVAMAFLGHVPDGTSKIVVDHKNKNRSDNRLKNLQIITSRQNNSKDRSRKKSKYTGVRKTKENKWRSSITINNKQIHLGIFETEKEASVFYKKALESIDKNQEIKIKKPTYSSIFKGVCFNKKMNKWSARVTKNNVRLFLGYFDTQEQANNSITLNQI